MQQKLKLRFAPSPNGFLHLGHAYSVLLNAEIAKALGVEFIIRMEDIDQLRCEPEYIEACLQDLAKLGLKFDTNIMYQSTRQEAYDKALEKLMQLGVLYPCLATRGEIKRHYISHEKISDPDGALIYPQLYKNLSPQKRLEIIHGTESYALRLDMQKSIQLLAQKLSFMHIDLDAEQIVTREFDPSVWGDVVIARKDIGTSYHLSVVVDDAAQNITHIVRGTDLYEATFIQRVLQMLLGLPEPAYFHHELVEDGDAIKLAKSRKSESLRDYWAKQIDFDVVGFDTELDLLAPATRCKLVSKIVVIINGSK